jgi:cation/acetate symporter
LIAARAALAITAMLSAWVALHWNVDPLNLFLWALSLTASGVLPVLIASIWWKRITRAGAVFGMLAGFSIAAVNILSDAALGAPEWLGLDSTLAAVFGVPLGVAVSVVVSLLGKAPGADVRDLVREIRMPGGETLLDREIRLARVAKAAGDAKIV